MRVCDSCHRSENDIRVAGGDQNDARIGSIVWNPAAPGYVYGDIADRYAEDPWTIMRDVCSDCSIKVFHLLRGTSPSA